MQKLSSSEEKVMLIIWQTKGPITYIEVQAGVEKRFGDKWKGQTVCTFINRLKNKGYISTFKEGRFTHYEVLISIEDYRKMQLEEMIERLYQGNSAKMIEELSE